MVKPPPDRSPAGKPTRAAPAKRAAKKAAARVTRPHPASAGGVGARRGLGVGGKTPDSSGSLSERPEAPADLAVRGRRTWAALADRVADDRGWVLLEEVCRIADRLDSLARALTGENRQLLELAIDEGIATFVVDNALVEARQQANALRQLVSALPLKETPSGETDPADDWVAGLSS